MQDQTLLPAMGLGLALLMMAAAGLIPGRSPGLRSIRLQLGALGLIIAIACWSRFTLAARWHNPWLTMGPMVIGLAAMIGLCVLMVREFIRNFRKAAGK